MSKEQRISPHYHALGIVSSAVNKHFTDPRFDHQACVDSPEEREKLKGELLTVLQNHAGICALTGLPTDLFGGSVHSVSLNKIDNNVNYMVWNVQVTSSAANLTFGNHPNELADEFFRFFSAHVATGEFDPTADPPLRLTQINQLPTVATIPIDVWNDFISIQLAKAREYDVKKFGSSDSTCNRDDALQILQLHRFRCAITAVALTIDEATLGCMSLDAIDSSKPHSADNIQWICLRLNSGKRDFPDAEYRDWAQGRALGGTLLCAFSFCIFYIHYEMFLKFFFYNSI